MNTDLYTKSVLTVIAGCLLYIATKDVQVIELAHAQNKGPVAVNIVGVGGNAFGLGAVDPMNPALPVRAAR